MKDKLIEYTKWLKTIDNGTDGSFNLLTNDPVIPKLNFSPYDVFMDNAKSEEWLVDQFIKWDRNRSKVETEYTTEFTDLTHYDLVNKGLMTNVNNSPLFKGFNIFIDPNHYVDIIYDESISRVWYDVYETYIPNIIHNGLDKVVIGKLEVTLDELNDDIKSIVNPITFDDTAYITNFTVQTFYDLLNYGRATKNSSLICVNEYPLSKDYFINAYLDVTNDTVLYSIYELDYFNDGSPKCILDKLTTYRPIHAMNLDIDSILRGKR